jgi:hypothetical protein
MSKLLLLALLSADRSDALCGKNAMCQVGEYCGMRNKVYEIMNHVDEGLAKRAQQAPTPAPKAESAAMRQQHRDIFERLMKHAKTTKQHTLRRRLVDARLGASAAAAAAAKPALAGGGLAAVTAATPNLTRCVECPPGHYQPERQTGYTKGVRSCVACSPGQVQPQARSSSCAPCGAGRHQPRHGMIQCDTCAAGRFQPAYFNGCQPCPPGKFGHRATHSSCSLCPEGKYTDAAAQVRCRRCFCPAGTYLGSTIGLSGPFRCKCAACAPGKFSAGGALDGCLDCAAGRFAARPRASACTACPLHLLSAPRHERCLGACPKGSQRLQRACIECGKGMFTVPDFKRKGGTTCMAQCPAGYFSSGWQTIGAGNSICLACPAGKHQPRRGQTACTACGVGTAQPYARASYCNPCPGGKFNPSEAQRGCSPCDAGSSSHGGDAWCQPCAAGKFQFKAGAGSCRDCPHGRFMPMVLPKGMQKRVKCYACSRGHGLFPSLDKSRCVGLIAHVREVRARNAAAVAARGGGGMILARGSGGGGNRGLGLYVASFKWYIVASVALVSSAYMGLGWYLRARDRGYRDIRVAIPPMDAPGSECIEFASKEAANAAAGGSSAAAGSSTFAGAEAGAASKGD